MSRTAPADRASCRTFLAQIAQRIPGATMRTPDQLHVAGERVAFHLGGTVVVDDVWAPIRGSSSMQNVFASQTWIPGRPWTTLDQAVASVSKAVAVRAQVKEVRRAA